MKFTVQVTETLQRWVEVDVSSARVAEDVVRKQYRSGDIVLGASDHVETEITALEGTVGPGTPR